MGWFHLFSKIKVVGNNFLSEQTVGWLIIFGVVVNRGFFAAHGLCCLAAAAAAAWGFPEPAALAGSASALTQTKAVLPGLGWPRSSLESALRTEHQGSVEEILKQNWSSFSPKHLIICVCRAKPGWGVSTGTTSERSSFGEGISFGMSEKCLPAPLQPVFHCCCRDGHPYTGSLYFSQKHILLEPASSEFTELHDSGSKLQSMPFIWTNSKNGREIKCVVKTLTWDSVFSLLLKISENFISVYTFKRLHITRGYSLPAWIAINCWHKQYLAIGFPIHITGFCLNFISCLFRENQTHRWVLTSSPKIQSDTVLLQ